MPMAFFYGVRRALDRVGIRTRMLFREAGHRNGFELRWGEDRPTTLRGAIATVVDNGTTFFFFVTNDSDTIQREALSGRFYERDELTLIEQHFRGGVFVDVGANVGNHTVFAAKALQAEKVICFEPNPEALRILDLNLRLNCCRGNVVVHSVGLSDRRSRGVLSAYRNNLGSARLIAADNGFPIEVGDEMLAGEPSVSFMKIDTEGFELLVLAGLERTIQQHRPTLFVEVDNKNISQFREMLARWRYKIAETIREYDDNQNILALPD